MDDDLNAHGTLADTTSSIESVTSTQQITSDDHIHPHTVVARELQGLKIYPGTSQELFDMYVIPKYILLILLDFQKGMLIYFYCQP